GLCFFIILIASWSLPAWSIAVVPAEEDTSGENTTTISANMPLTDNVYQELQTLAVTGLLDTFLGSNKPMAISQVAALISRVHTELSDRTPHYEWWREYLGRLDKRYGKSAVSRNRIGPLRFRSWNIGYFWLRQPARLIPETNAHLVPFLSNREGRSFDPGYNLFVEGTFDFRLSSFALLSAQARWRHGGDTHNAGQIALRNVYLKMHLRGIELQAGRDNLAWGHGFSGSMGLNNNTQPFDFFKLSNLNPYHLPWLLNHLGPIKSTVFLARLDKDRTDFPNPSLFGLSLNATPRPWLEIGLHRWMLFRGKGSTDAGFKYFITDFFFRLGTPKNRSAINNASELDLRFRLPYSGGMHLYANVYWEDSNVLDNFPFLPYKLERDTASMFGMSIPNLLTKGRLGLQAEHVRTTLITYRHSRYNSGFTFKQRLLGHDLGPSGQGGYIRLKSTINHSFDLILSTAIERRGDEITNTPMLNNLRADPGHATGEWRYRFIPGFCWDLSSNRRLTGQIGYERVKSFSFSKNAYQHNAFFEFGIKMGL
ncbi:uncharacterized protein METZ01_LOCUS106849, partial [marine metagenome]